MARNGHDLWPFPARVWSVRVSRLFVNAVVSLIASPTLCTSLPLLQTQPPPESLPAKANMGTAVTPVPHRFGRPCRERRRGHTYVGVYCGTEHTRLAGPPVSQIASVINLVIDGGALERVRMRVGTPWYSGGCPLSSAPTKQEELLARNISYIG